MSLRPVAPLVSWISFAGLVALSSACTAPANGTARGAGADGGAAAPDAATADPAGLTCLVIVQCITDCATSDSACADGCVTKGSPEGQRTVTALATCIDKEKCTDETCLQAKCQPSLDECATSSARGPSGRPAQGSAPPGDVPADMVGSYARANYGQTTRLILRADGTGSYQIAVASTTSGCFTTSSTTESGNAVVATDKITIYSTATLSERKICSAPIVRETGEPSVVELSYTREDANTLRTIDTVCAAKYPDSPSSVALYCSERLSRE